MYVGFWKVELIVKIRLFVFGGVALLPVMAHAYIGPGMAGGAIAAVLGIVAALFFGFVGIVYFPIKRWFQRRKEQKLDNSEKIEG